MNNIEIFLSAFSILLSAIAVIISVHTAIQQSKIALFDIRYQLYSEISRFIDSALNYDDSPESLSELVEMEAVYKTNVLKTEWVFSKKVKSFLDDSYKLFEEHIKYYHNGEKDPAKEDKIKKDVQDVKDKFESKISKYLKV